MQTTTLQDRMKNKKRITLGDWSGVIDTDHGANCISLQNKKYDAMILREPPQDRALDNPYLYGMPILFPVNRIERGRFTFEGREYVFPINEPATGCHLHGELHRMAFEVVEEGESYVKCRFRAEKREYLGFPHAFEICQEYALKQDGLHHTVTVRNRSSENMPVFLGFHTTFQTCFTSKSSPDDIRVFADITEEFERNMAVNYLPTGVRPPFDAVSEALAKGEYRPFEGKASRHYRGQGLMIVTDVGQGLRLVYENDEAYGYRLIFNGGDEGYICLEPQTCLANCQNAPFPRAETGFDWIEAGKSKIYRSRIDLEECDV